MLPGPYTMPLYDISYKAKIEKCNQPTYYSKHRELGKVRKQMNRLQTKKKDITSVKELNEVEISKLPIMSLK